MAPQLSDRPNALNLALAPALTPLTLALALILTLLALTLALTNPLSPNWLQSEVLYMSLDPE